MARWCLSCWSCIVQYKTVAARLLRLLTSDSRNQAVEPPCSVERLMTASAGHLQVELPGPVEWLMTTTVGRFQDAMDPWCALCLMKEEKDR
eukprot:1150964-Pelagomonas_calceolata.AAC.6